MLFSGVPRRGCGIQRTPGAKLMVEKRNKQDITGCAHVGGGYLRGGCFLPCYTARGAEREQRERRPYAPLSRLHLSTSFRLEMIAPKSHTVHLLANINMDLRRMKEGAMWRAGYVDVRRYRQSPITHANHEDALTNARSMRPAINNESYIMVGVRQHHTRTQPGAQSPLRQRPKLPQITL